MSEGRERSSPAIPLIVAIALVVGGFAFHLVMTRLVMGWAALGQRPPAWAPPLIWARNGIDRFGPILLVACCALAWLPGAATRRAKD